MYSIYIKNENKYYTHKILEYIALFHEPTELYVSSIENLNGNGINDNKTTINYEFMSSKPITINHNNNKIHIENTQSYQEQQLSDGVYYQNTCIKMSGDSKKILEDFIIEIYKYFEFKTDRKRIDKKILIFKYDFGWIQSHIVNERPIETIYLPDDNLKKILDDINYFKSKEVIQRYQELALTHKRTYLFHGIPGSGKSSLVRGIASQFNMSISILDFDNELTDKSLRNAFKKLPENTILLLEDIDCLFNERKSHDSMKNSLTFSGLLNALDGVVQNNNTIIIITTNHVEVLDIALKRRLDVSIEFTYVKKPQVKTMFEKFFPNKIENFDKFYDSIKNLKLNTNILQKFFSRHLFDDNIIEYINELEQATKFEIQSSNKDLYN